MSEKFKNHNPANPNNDFRQFLSALSGAPGSARPARPGEKHQSPPGRPGAAPIQSKSHKDQQPQSPYVPKKPAPPGPRITEQPPVSPKGARRSIHTSRNDSAQYLMSSREKAPEMPMAQETAFLPRVDDISHPLAEPAGSHPAPRPTTPLRSKSFDTGDLTKPPLRTPPPPPREPIKKSSPQAEESPEKIALSHISIRAHFTLEQLLETMIRENASDLHVATGSVPSLRISGEIIKMELPDLDREMADNLLLPILTEEQRSTFEEEGDIDFSFDYLNKARFRINYYRHHWGIGASFRLIPLEIPKLDQLGLPNIVKNLLRLKKGLILLAGPSGSGKSTTIASMLEEINIGRKLRIITIENPIEYSLPSKMSLISQRELGSSASNYTEALWAVLREDPDIIMVSELWDPEDIRQVLKISETGHLVISSIRTVDCTKAVERLVDAFPYDEQDQIKVILSESLAGIVAQRLIPRADRRGRVLACEVLLETQGLATTIRESKYYQIPSIIQTGRELGMQTMDQSLLDLIEKRLITPQAAKQLASDHRFFLRMGVRFDE